MCRFDGDIIVEVRAHVDSMMVAYTILRNEAEQGTTLADKWLNVRAFRRRLGLVWR